MSAAPREAAGLREAIDAAAQQIRAKLPGGAAPRVGLVLGSGLGDYANRFAERVVIPYRELPGFPPSTIVGHAGNLVYGRAGTPEAIEVLAMQGRVHSYEGHGLAEVAFPIRALVGAGCTTLIVTNAAGGLDPTMSDGELVVLSDHLNLLASSPLRGPNDDRVGPRFPDMTDVYDPELRRVALEAGLALGMRLREGVYACLPGPAYETPAEVRMLRTLGADMVGMSTVPEVIAARHMGARVLGFSCVTNLAAGISKHKLSHAEVTETAARVREKFIALLDGVLGRLAARREPS